MVQSELPIMGGRAKRKGRGVALVAAVASVLACVAVVASQVGTWGGVEVGGIQSGSNNMWLDPLASTGPVTLEGRGVRGPDLGKAPHPTSDVHTTASPHASSPLKDLPKVDEAEVSKAKISSVMPKVGSQIWKTEQAMKKQLDASTQRKGGNLWKQTVDIVHGKDPNFKDLSDFKSHDTEDDAAAETTVKEHGPHHAKASAEHRLRTKSLSMKQRLENELNAKVKATLGHMNGQSMHVMQAAFAHKNGGHVAESARAHATMKLGSMKKMLKSQLDTSVDHVVKRAKELGVFSNSAQLEKRLKAELDQKTQQQQHKMLQQQSSQSNLAQTRKRLSGKVSRAQMVREQLTKEMREENAIRRQLNLQADAQGKKMLQNDISGSHGNKKQVPHVYTKQDMEERLKKQLDQKTEAQLEHKGGSGSDSTREFGTLGPSQKTHLEAYLRKKLMASDSKTQSHMFEKSMRGRIASKGGDTVADKNSALTAAEMRLFKDSMHRAENNEHLTAQEKAHEHDEGTIINTEKGLLDKVLELSKPGDKAAASHASASKTVSPPGQAPVIKDMAHASGHVSVEGVHDMAHASGRKHGGGFLSGQDRKIAMGLGDQEAIRSANEVRSEQDKSRKKLVKFAVHEDQEAVE